MSESIGPGDWVECVSRTRLGVLSIGALYCVTEAEVEQSACEACGARCAGLRVGQAPNPAEAGWDGHNWWGSCFFRPIYRPKASIIEALKAPVTQTPEVVGEGSREAQKDDARCAQISAELGR